jgi:alpha-beta hydrolase superfamily lysophospholipase
LAEPLGVFAIEEFAASDGYRWRYRRYPSQGPAKAEVVCIHGIQSHAGWYEHSCTRLAQAGFATTFLDRRGAGMNEVQRGDAPSFRRLLDDIAEFLNTRRLEKTPIFLVGISWGGKLAVALQRRHPGLVDGLALLCPGFFARVGPSLGQRFRILWCRLFRPTRLFPIPLNDPALFTVQPRWQQFLVEDPLRLHLASARLLLESARLDGYLCFCKKNVNVPVLLMLAGNDRIIDNERTRTFFERFASTDKKIMEYAEAHHTLEFEPDPDRFIGDLIHWLESHIPNAGS